jgi:predicted transcriptional regulator
MNDLAVRPFRLKTVREVAQQLGCHPETVKYHIRVLFPGLMRKTKTTFLNERQTTIILEKMMQGGACASRATGGDAGACRSAIANTGEKMTIKEIARVCGVDRVTVARWAHKLTDNPVQNAQAPMQNAQGIAAKLEQAEKSGKEPADFTLEETLAIIRAGGNDTLAALLKDNARGGAAFVSRAPGSPITAAFLRELTAAYDKALITRRDWRVLAGLDPAPKAAGKQPDLPLLEDRTGGDAEFIASIHPKEVTA